MKDQNDPIASLPRLPALSAATQALFQAIETRNASAMVKAIEAGANLEAFEPYRLEGSELVGGHNPLQRACSVNPDQAVPLEIVAILLDAGADPNAFATQTYGGGALARIAESLPNNGAQAVEMLVAAGALPHIDLIDQALLAEKTWIGTRLSNHALPLVNSIWAVLPESERALLDPNLVSRLVGEQGSSPEVINRAKWVVEHTACEPQSSLRDRLTARRENSDSVSRAPGQRVH